MIDPTDKYWVECQDCGERVKKLSHAQYVNMTYSPYDYVIYCAICLPHHPDFEREV
jgi:hypothetical protein